jgi:phosphoenolpyruvate carboxykinase (GTP)
MIKRVEGKAGAVETPIGNLPKDGDLNLDGIALSDEARSKLFGYDRGGWQAEFASIGDYLSGYGPRMPEALLDEQQRIASALGS